MARLDASVRAELAADGSFFDGYCPRMEAVHIANANRLAAIIDEFGWPGRSLVGDDGAEAAWLIAQHAISLPGFMRRCVELVKAADVPRWHFAYLDDRIATFEGRPQRYGTQLDDAGMPLPLADAERVNAWRAEVGLPPIKQTVGPDSDDLVRESRQEEDEWKRRVGWLK